MFCKTKVRLKEKQRALNYGQVCRVAALTEYGLLRGWSGEANPRKNCSSRGLGGIFSQILLKAY